jgi:hypothetical protein
MKMAALHSSAAAAVGRPAIVTSPPQPRKRCGHGRNSGREGRVLFSHGDFQLVSVCLEISCNARVQSLFVSMLDPLPLPFPLLKKSIFLTYASDSSATCPAACSATRRNLVFLLLLLLLLLLFFFLDFFFFRLTRCWFTLPSLPCQIGLCSIFIYALFFRPWRPHRFPAPYPR